jgi:hypothetical protein
MEKKAFIGDLLTGVAIVMIPQIFFSFTTSGACLLALLSFISAGFLVIVLFIFPFFLFFLDKRHNMWRARGILVAGFLGIILAIIETQFNLGYIFSHRPPNCAIF